MDNLTPTARSENMSKIRGCNTDPEKIVRTYLFSHGLRFRKNDRRYPGTPDVVLPKYKTAVFVNGCFWHCHEGCKDFLIPKSNTDFWQRKLDGNVKRDRRNYSILKENGWRVIVVWECELKKSNRADRLSKLFQEITSESVLEMRNQ